MLKPRNIFSNWLLFFFHAITALLLSPYLVKCLGDVGYGIWIFVNSVTGYMGLLTIGIYPTINKYVAEYVAMNNIKSLNIFLGTCRIILLITGLISLIAGIIISFTIHDILKGISDSAYPVRIVVLIVSLQVFVSIIFNIYESILVGLQKFELTRMINGLNILLKSVAIYLLLYFGYKLLEITVATLIFYMVECLIQRYYTYRNIEDLNMSLKNSDIKQIKNVLGFSGYIFIITLAARVAFQTDTIVIGYYMNATTITYFAIASNLIMYAQQIQFGIAGVVFPLASELHAKNEKEKLLNLFIDSTRYSILVSIPLCIGFISFGGDFIKLWMGEKYQLISGNILIILAIGQIIALSQGCTNAINICTGNHKKLAVIMMAEAIINLILSIVLINSIGIYGVAWGTTIPIIIVRMFIIPQMTTRYLKYDFQEYIKRTYIKIIPAFTALIITTVSIKHLKNIDNWINLILVGVFSVIVYFAVVYITYLKSHEIDYIKVKYRRMLCMVGMEY